MKQGADEWDAWHWAIWEVREELDKELEWDSPR